MNIQSFNQGQQPNFGITPVYRGNNPAKSRAKLAEFIGKLSPEDRAAVLRKFEKSPARVAVTYARHDSDDLPKIFGLELKLADATDQRDPWAIIWNGKLSREDIKEFKQNFLSKLPVPKRPKRPDAEVKRALDAHLGLKG